LDFRSLPGRGGLALRGGEHGRPAERPDEIETVFPLNFSIQPVRSIEDDLEKNINGKNSVFAEKYHLDTIHE
jgi:hypothetical protein